MDLEEEKEVDVRQTQPDYHSLSNSMTNTKWNFNQVLETENDTSVQLFQGEKWYCMHIKSAEFPALEDAAVSSHVLDDVALES